MRKNPPETSVPTPSRRSRVQSAGTAVSVLKMLADMGGAASLTALSARLEESPAKVHRYLVSLVESELVCQDPSTARYVLGPEAIAIGLAALRQSDAVTLAAAESAALAEAHQLSSFVAVLGNRGPTIVRWQEPIQPVTVNVRVGSVLPVLWSATGRAFGAFSDAALLQSCVAEELAAATREQKRQLANRAAVQALFREIRALRCAPVRDVLLNGVSAVAAPILDAEARVAAVLTALGPTGGFDPTPGGSAATLVLRAADAVSARLGYRKGG